MIFFPVVLPIISPKKQAEVGEELVEMHRRILGEICRYKFGKTNAQLFQKKKVFE